MVDESISQIQQIFCHTKSKSYKDTKKNQIPEIVSFFFEEEIISRWVFEIFFSVCRDKVVEDEDIDAEQVSSVADGHEKQCTQEYSLHDLGVPSFHEERKEKHESKAIGNKEPQTCPVRIIQEIELDLPHRPEQISIKKQWPHQQHTYNNNFERQMYFDFLVRKNCIHDPNSYIHYYDARNDS